jgi:hypothetical protein
MDTVQKPVVATIGEALFSKYFVSARYDVVADWQTSDHRPPHHPTIAGATDLYSAIGLGQDLVGEMVREMAGEWGQTSPRDLATKRGVCLPVLVVDRVAELPTDRPPDFPDARTGGTFSASGADVSGWTSSAELIGANASDEVMAAIAAAGAATPASGVRTATDG